MSITTLQLEDRAQVVTWLRQNYEHATTTSVSKRSVFSHYLEACNIHKVSNPISHTYFGKLVRKAFPDVRCNRRGPRGSAQQHYRLARVDGLENSDDLLTALELEEPPKKRRRVSSITSHQLQQNPTSFSSKTFSAGAAHHQLLHAVNPSEAWSFSSAPSSPTEAYHLHPPDLSSPAQSSSEDDEAGRTSSSYNNYRDRRCEEEEDNQNHRFTHEASSSYNNYRRSRSEEEEDDFTYEEDGKEQEEALNEEDEDEDEDEEEEEVKEEELPASDASMLDIRSALMLPGKDSPGSSFSFDLGSHDNSFLAQDALTFVQHRLNLPLSAINNVGPSEELSSSHPIKQQQSSFSHASSCSTPLLLRQQLSAPVFAELAEWLAECN